MAAFLAVAREGCHLNQNLIRLKPVRKNENSKPAHLHEKRKAAFAMNQVSKPPVSVLEMVF